MVREPIQIPPTDVSQEHCDFYLGNYMRAFNQLEIQLMGLFTKLLDAPDQAAHIVFHSGINAQTMREIIVALARLRLGDSDFRKVESLMLGAVKKAVTKRNRLVHGQWQLALKMKPKQDGQPPIAETASWQRLYVPTDPYVYQQMFGKPPNAKVRAAHVFSIKDIQNAAQDTADLAARIKNLLEGLVLRPYIPPQPVF